MAEDKFSSDMNFNKVLFLHLNRTAQSVVNNELFMANIGVFEILLSPYQDDDYEKDISSKKGVTTAISALDPMLKAKTDLNSKNAIANASHNFRCLMALAERKGLLLEEKVTGEDEDEES